MHRLLVADLKQFIEKFRQRLSRHLPEDQMLERERILRMRPSPEAETASDDRGCGESREMELLWPYAFPHEAPEKASPEELGVPQWYATTAPQVKAEEPPTAVRSRSWARAEGRKGRRVSHTQMGHVRTPSAGLMGSPKADGGLQRSIFGGNVQQVLEDLAKSA